MSLVPPAPTRAAEDTVSLTAVPDQPFDVEPEYIPDHEALAEVEKYEDRFLDRELSWLRFNERVLELAEDETLPLLERVRFLAIFTSNLDEFFMVRVAALKRAIDAGDTTPDPAGLSPARQMQLGVKLYF